MADDIALLKELQAKQRALENDLKYFPRYEKTALDPLVKFASEKHQELTPTPSQETYSEKGVKYSLSNDKEKILKMMTRSWEQTEETEVESVPSMTNEPKMLWDKRKILIAVDNSKHSEKILRHCVDKKFITEDDHVSFLHVLQEGESLPMDKKALAWEDNKELSSSFRNYATLKDIMWTMKEKNGLKFIIRDEDLVNAIVGTANSIGANLIILGYQPEKYESE